jgi:hypothetical protein
VRGTEPGSQLTPRSHGDDPAVIDTTNGAVHMIIGGGGHSLPTPGTAFDTPNDGVLIYDVGPGDPMTQRASKITTEPAAWSAYRDLQTPYGFAAFDFEPHGPHGTTTITVKHYGAAAGSKDYRQLDTFTLRKPRGHR